MDFSTFADRLGEIAGLVGSLTAIGGFLLFIYNKTISAPREKRRAEREESYQKQLREAVTKQTEPIVEALTALKNSNDRHKRFGKQLEGIAEQNAELLKKHEDRLDNHNERLLVLEVKNGVRSKIQYVEKYEGGESR